MPAGSSPWRVLNEQLVTTGNVDLQRDLTRAVRAEGTPTLAAVRSAWLSIEVTSDRGGKVRPDTSTRLRWRTALATRIAATPKGVSITVNGRAIDPIYGNTLAWYLNASGRPWRHPIFGRRANSADWAVQRGQEVFFSTVRARQPAFRAAIEAAMESTARRF
jgi:hypothetical protein